MAFKDMFKFKKGQIYKILGGIIWHLKTCLNLKKAKPPSYL